MKSSMIADHEVTLRPASMADRPNVFAWFTNQEFGGLLYPEGVKPTWDDFFEDYTDVFFQPVKDARGACFIILCNGMEVGVVNYDGFRPGKPWVELDIVLASEGLCGQRLGSRALTLFVKYLAEEKGLRIFLIRPSAANRRAVRAYEKCGFRRLHMTMARQEELFGPADSEDSLAMILTLDVFPDRVPLDKIIG